VKALGQLVKWDEGELLSHFEYPLPLAEALVRAGSAHAGQIGERLAELGRSFAHDVLNLAAIAGRLLWCEGVSPNRWRSHDLVSVSVDVEAYFVMLQTACDIMAGAISLLAAKRNQAPSESFHSLNQWARKNPARLLAPFRIVAQNLPWFNEINGVRTKLVHRGGSVWIYTDRVKFQWGVHGTGRTPSQRKRSKSNGDLLDSLGRLTRKMLSFSAKLADAVTTARGNVDGERLVLSGVCVPALDHLLRIYKPPIKSESLLFSARCLLASGSYVSASVLQYPNGHWWKFLMRMCRDFARAPDFLSVPVSVAGRVDDCRFVFADGTELYGILAYDHFATDEYGSNDDWVRNVLRAVGQLQTTHNLRRFVVVARTGKPIETFPESSIPVVVESDPLAGARRAFYAVRKRDYGLRFV
jgi:hypothetical protein